MQDYTQLHLELTPAPVVGAAPSGKLTINHQFIYKAIQ
jgi:hypothetical protein